jgi:CRP-like cAMP-binding protein
MNTKLFRNYREDLFDSHYFNCFKAIKKYKGDYIFHQNEKRRYIYFIKKGDIQIELHSSWNEFDKILEILGNKNINNKKALKDLIFTNEKLEIFSQKKQKFNISIYSSGEILGLEEHIYPKDDLFMFSSVCLSECDIFSLEIQFIEKMMNERLLKNNYNKLIKEKK